MAGAGNGRSHMYVNTNVAALNAWQNLDNTQNSMNTVLDQLSSGYRINSAADDPAGLAISQQMQSQIGGLNQAYSNAQSGISLLQTAGGALTQIQNILQSMRSLASEAATATMNTSDAQNLQAEMNQYTQEITQITNTTQFNNINLLGGAFSNQSIQVGANQGQSLSMTLAAADAYSLGITGQTGTITTAGEVASSITDVSGMPNDSYTLAAAVTPWSFTLSGPNSADFTSAVGSGVNVTSAATATVTVTAAQVSGTSAAQIQVTQNGQTADYTATGDSGASTFDNVSIAGNNFNLKLADTAATNDTFTMTLNPTNTTYTLTDTASGATASTSVLGEVSNGQNVSVSLGDGSVSFNSGDTIATQTAASYTTSDTGATTAPTAPTTTDWTAALSGASATTYSDGTGNATATTGVNITTQSGAQAALTVIDAAIGTLSTQQGNVGALENRLQFASTNDQTGAENLTAAKGGIMDTDMASAMSLLSQDQVLQQSGVAMLAQANAVPQALLKLLP